ncbi:hypothetical protein [Streptomyces fumanus]|uniref:hypothetical protein n=1 Tax=Streptomyces fumanus TaxID=67302 RepID=UPI003401BFBF
MADGEAGPDPLGATKASASTPLKASGQSGRPPVKSAADPGFYAPGVGQVPWSEFFTAQLSDSVSAQINYGIGNLLLTSTVSASPTPARAWPTATRSTASTGHQRRRAHHQGHRQHRTVDRLHLQR